MAKLKDILMDIGNVAGVVFLQRPIFARRMTEVILPQNTSNKIAAAIAITEMLVQKSQTIRDLPGPEKLAIAASLAKEAILASSALTGAEVEDQIRFDTGVNKITDGWNDVLKSLKQK